MTGGNLEQKYVISIDMGGTKILAAVINSKEGIVARVKKSTEKGVTATRYVNDLSSIIYETISEAGIKPGSIKAVCIGVPGSVNPNTGLISLAPNLGIHNYNMKEKLQKHVPYPIILENDVHLGALGIKNFGIGKKALNMLAVFIGTGIGGGLIFNNKIFRGSNFSAGEIGHIKVMDGGPLCGCGNRGCFEALASRTAIVKAIGKDILKGKKKSILKELFIEGKPVKSRSLAGAIKKGDKVVIKNIAEACKITGRVLANVNNLLNLDMIVLGGGVIEAMSGFMVPLIRESFYESTLKASAKGLKIVPSNLKDDAALYGAIALAEEFTGIRV
jgi:glucokinase